jgi:hypothetical protein
LRKATSPWFWISAVLLAVPPGLPAAQSQSNADNKPEPAEPSQPLCGRLTNCEGLTVLELWGTPEQSGYAHGFLLAEEIVRLFDGYVLSRKVMPNPQVYELMFVPGVRRQFVWSPACERELKALAQGIQDRLGADKLRSEVLDRPLKLEDLMVANALADWFGMTCSTFSVWGPLSADGQTITARNLDFPSTSIMERQQLVVIRRGEGKTRSWIGVTWPALIGVYTAMNDAGVTMLVHDAPGLSPSEAVGFTPRSLTLREALERASPESFVSDVRRVLESRRVMVGNNIHVSGPLTDREPPAVVFEYDANAQSAGVTLRTAETSGAAVKNALWCTNHLRLRRPPQECRRYELLEQRLTHMTRSSEKLDPSSALRLIRAVKQDMTLHSVCFVPHRKTMYVDIPAISEAVVEFNLEEWLKRPRDPAAPTAKPAGRASPQEKDVSQRGEP